jgi:hypothetical protein
MVHGSELGLVEIFGELANFDQALAAIFGRLLAAVNGSTPSPPQLE